MPEVETIRRDLASVLTGRKILGVEILAPKSASHPAAFFKSALIGRKIAGVDRRGKLLIFKLSSAASRTKKSQLDYLLIHLKMTGQLIYSDSRQHRTAIAGGHSLSPKSQTGAQTSAVSPAKHTRATFVFSGGGRLAFNDLRRFGYLKLVSAAELDRLLKNNYGPEPLSSGFSRAALTQILKGKKTKIKALLLDQKRIAGLGNIYADEVLWAAGIAPERPAGKVKPAEIAKLFLAINRIIKLAIKYRGTTFNNYVDSRGRSGGFYRLLKVYGRAGEKCPRCGGVIKKNKVVGRGTHYCDHCQK